MDMYVTEKGFRIWAMNSFESCKKRVIDNTDKGKNAAYSNVVVYYNNNNSVATIVNTVTGHIAQAKMNRHCDEGDSEIGVGVAWARFLNKPIPTVVKELTTISMLEVGDKFGFVYSKKSMIYEVVGKIRFDEKRENVLAVRPSGTDYLYAIDQILTGKSPEKIAETLVYIL